MSLTEAMARFFVGRMGGQFLHQIFAAGVRFTGKEFVDVSGCFDHTVQVSTLNGTDVIRVRASVNGVTFEQISAPLDAIGANGIYLFQGSFKKLQFTKQSGTGTTTEVWYAGRP